MLAFKRVIGFRRNGMKPPRSELLHRGNLGPWRFPLKLRRLARLLLPNTGIHWSTVGNGSSLGGNIHFIPRKTPVEESRLSPTGVPEQQIAVLCHRHDDKRGIVIKSTGPLLNLHGYYFAYIQCNRSFEGDFFFSAGLAKQRLPSCSY